LDSTPSSTPTITPTPSNPVFTSANFVYDGDGKRVKSVMNTSQSSTTTYFIGGHYEVANGVVTKYYYAGSQRVAIRTNGTLNYILGDHLGSTSLTTDANGVVISEMRYKAWGETRYASGTTPTKYQYTGQYSYTADFGLHFYNARWYDSSLSRFAQADTDVPASQGVQGLNRYAYSNNNPLKYTDPSGHDPICDQQGTSCGGGRPMTRNGRMGVGTNPTPTPGVTNTASGVSGYVVLASGYSSSSGYFAGPNAPSGIGQHLNGWQQFAESHGYEYDFFNYPGWENGHYGKDEQADDIFTALEGIVANNESIPIVIVGYSGGADSALLAAEMAHNAGMDVRAVVLLDPGFTTGSWEAPNEATVTRSQTQMATIVGNLTSNNVPVYIVDNGPDYIDSYLTGTGAYYASDLVTADHTDVDNNPGVIGAIDSCIFQNSCSSFTIR